MRAARARSRPGGAPVSAALGRSIALLAACAVLIALTLTGSARADVFSPVTLVSYGVVGADGVLQQVEYAHDSAISANGQYVAFDGSIGGVTGVWRRDLATDVIEQVAGGDAAMPSISEEGRYVSFTTNEGATLPEVTRARPVAEHRTEAVNVYRRDMDNAPAETAAEEASRPAAERAFLAASVPSGSEEPLRYSDPGEHGGSYAVGRTAMSANGEEVAFVTAAVSNLVRYPLLEAEEEARGEAPVPHTPAGQVAVHRFPSNAAGAGTTELVTRCRFHCGQGAAGAAEPVVVGEGESKAVGGAAVGAARFPVHGRDGSWPGASLSADGSTVAWIAQNVEQQAPTLADEHLEAIYEEPLWRRLPAAANITRRVTGGSDPEAPGCAASGELVLEQGSENEADPCQGPFVREETGASAGDGLIKIAFDDTPRLSADGEEVLFGANARTLAEKEDFDRGAEGNPTDVFLVNMRPGLSRRQAITPVTQVGSPSSTAESAEVTDFEISPDGSQVAFTTIRTRFALGFPTLISSVLPEVGISELYDADLADGTLTRVTHGYGGEGEQSQQPHRVYTESGDPYQAVGEPSELGALTPDFSQGGEQLVFTSTAGNLVYGDGNEPAEPVSCCQPGDGSDVFEVSRIQFPGEAVTQVLSTASPIGLTPAWQLHATAQSRADGSVVLYVQAPGNGSLRVSASGQIVRTKRVGKGRHARTRRSLVTRTVSEAQATETPAAGGLLELVLHVKGGYGALLERSDGLPASLRLSFASPGRATLGQTLAVIFKRTAHAKKAKQTKKPKKAMKAVGRHRASKARARGAQA